MSDDKKDVHSKMIGLATAGLHDYSPQGSVVARRLLNDPANEYVTSKELSDNVDPRSLDGNRSTFTLAERRAWAHFLAQHGVIAPFGGHVMSRRDVLSDVSRTQNELSSLHAYYQKHPPSGIQWVHLKIEDWNEFFKFFGVSKEDRTSFQKKFLDEVSRFYKDQGRQANIRFTFDPPQRVKKYKTIYIATRPTSTGGTFLAASGAAPHIAKALETIWFAHRDFYFDPWTNEFPKAQIIVMMRRKILEAMLLQGYSPGLDVLWQSSDIEALKVKLAGTSLPQTPAEIAKWMEEEPRNMTQDSARYREGLAYQGSLSRAADGVLRDYIRSEMGKGESLADILKGMAVNPVVREVLGYTFDSAGVSLWGETPNYGNQSLDGVMVANLSGFNPSLPVPRRFTKVASTIAHETGHLIGLQHHYVSKFSSTGGMAQPLMLAGGWRDDLATHFKLLPENEEYLQLFLGLRLAVPHP